jgi:lactobin A/cerein 7B family class IIb bacteriocin
MKKLDLNALGVKEMNHQEMAETDGGWWQLAIAVATIAIYAYNNWDDFVEGVKEGYNGK